VDMTAEIARLASAFALTAYDAEERPLDETS
jgi:hypothetical protein